MSFLGGIIRSVINPATLMQVAMGPTGWLSIAARAVASAVVQQVIQQVGSKLGVPQSAINNINSRVDQQLGTNTAGRSPANVIAGLGEDQNSSPAQIGFAQRETQNQVDQINKMAEKAFEKVGSGTKRSPGEKISWLQALADAMTKVVDASLNKMSESSTKLADAQNDLMEKNSVQSKDGKRTTDQANAQNASTKAQQDFNVSVQEFNVISQSVTNAIKTIGESLSSMARKQ